MTLCFKQCHIPSTYTDTVLWRYDMLFVLLAVTFLIKCCSLLVDIDIHPFKEDTLSVKALSSSLKLS